LQPNSDPDAARWMTLLEALEHIESVEKCDRVAAQVRLKRGIGHRVIPVKWADSEGPNDKPNVTELQRSQLVLSGPGLAPSDLSLRPLSIFRPAVHATWSRTTSEAAGPLEANQNARNVSAEWKVEEKDGQWMSLVEAAEHIQMSQHCGSVEALRQLKREIGDGMVPVQWEDSEGPKDCPDPDYLQRSKLLLVGTGLAPDNVHKIFRSLLVERSATQRLWPLSKHERNDFHTTDSQPAAPQHQLTRPASEARIREVLKEIYSDPGNNRPNVNEAWDLLKAKVPNARKNLVMDILKEPEFANQRRGAGNQPKV